MSHFTKQFLKTQKCLQADKGDQGGQQSTEDKETLETLQNSVVTLQEEIKKLQKKNEELNTHNQKLFLKVTGEEKKEETKDDLSEYKEYVGEKFFNSLSNKQQKLLISILEGDDE